MLTPVLCFTCGLPTGDVAPMFRAARAKRVAATLKDQKIDPTQAAISADLQIECGDILDRLGVTYPCCRKTLTTGMCFMDYYK